jgi:predicted acylesterase/phospholipase RssA
MKGRRSSTGIDRRPKIGLALGSASARGWAHIGILEALDEAGIRPDVVCGCSIGALVGASYVAGRLSQLKQWAETLTWREIIGLIDVNVSSGGLISGPAYAHGSDKTWNRRTDRKLCNPLRCDRDRSCYRPRGLDRDRRDR